MPACEYFPFEAVKTNIEGAENIVRAIVELKLPVQSVVAISTDKACKPTNVMGMTKAIQERIFLAANISCPQTRFIAVRYGNVLALTRISSSTVYRSNCCWRTDNSHRQKHDEIFADP
ncbi:uncharacterized membrane protein MJ1061 [Acidimicrobiaceae bacterium]|nr:uncharacterized membrane protein MJ1061 [Acidimicrobiaceae bacterium]